MERKKQNFENYPELTEHIERMASTGRAGTGSEWCDFLNKLNEALSLKGVVCLIEQLKDFNEQMEIDNDWYNRVPDENINNYCKKMLKPQTNMTEQRKQWIKDEAHRMLNKLASRMPSDAAKEAAIYLADQHIEANKGAFRIERGVKLWENIKKELELIEV